MRTTCHLVRAKEASGLVIDCTGLDVLSLGLQQPLVWLFKQRLDHAALIAALPSVLEQFPLFAGQLLLGPHWLRILCNNHGVPVEVVERDDTLDDWLPHLNAPKFSRMAISGLKLKRGTPVMRVRVNHFRGGGSSLAIIYDHAIGDARTFLWMIRAWANATCGKPVTAPTLVADRPGYLARHLPSSRRGGSALFRATNRQGFSFLARVLTEVPRSQQLTLYFTEAEIAAIKRELSTQSGVELSSVTALLGHFVALLHKVYPKQRNRHVFLPVEWRVRCGIPADVLGNMLALLRVDCHVGQPATAIAAQARLALNTFVEERMSYAQDELFIAEAGWKNRRALSPAGMMSPGALLISCVRGFGVSDLSFGTCRPLFFSAPRPIPTPGIGRITEGFNNRDAVIEVSLPRAAAEALRVEPTLHRYRPAGDEIPDDAKRVHWML